MNGEGKVFYVVNIKKRKTPSIYAYLNSLKFIASPETRTRAHVTVRGPKNGKLSDDQQRRLNERLGESLIINGVGSFLYSNQNTVYLSCSTDGIEGVWDKPDYGDGVNPHLTIYDGDKEGYAKDILGILSKNTSIKFRIKNIKLEGLISGRNDFIKLKSRVSDKDIEKSTGLRVGVEEIVEMNRRDRLSLIFLIWRRLSYINYNVDGCIREEDFKNIDDDVLNKIGGEGYQFRMFSNGRGVNEREGILA